MMVLQKKKPLPGQHRKVEPLTRKAEPARKIEPAQKAEPTAPPYPQLEILQERMNHLATKAEMHKLHGEAMESIGATRTEMHKLHGEAMESIEATRTEMHKLHGEAMESIEATRTEMHKLHGETMERISKVEGDLTFIKWTLSVFVAPLVIAMAAGILKLVFFP